MRNIFPHVFWPHLNGWFLAAGVPVLVIRLLIINITLSSNVIGLKRGTWGGPEHRNTAKKINEHRITARKVDGTPSPQQLPLAT